MVTSGCLVLVSFVAAAAGVVLVVSGVRSRGTLPGDESSAAVAPPNGAYTCMMTVGEQRVAIRKFSLENGRYNDLSFNQGSGSYQFDATEGSLTFPDGPFANHFSGLFAAKGQRFRTPEKVQFGGELPTATADTIRLLDANTDYSRQKELGVPCELQ